MNNHLHTDAIKENLIPRELTKKEAAQVYASEADVLGLPKLAAHGQVRRMESEFVSVF